MRGYPTAIINLTQGSVYVIMCPRCGGVVSIEEERMEDDEIGECEACHQLVFIPWKE